MKASEIVEEHYRRVGLRDTPERSVYVQNVAHPDSAEAVLPHHSDSHFRRGVRDGQALVTSDWDPSEPEQIIAEFSKMLRMATGDGAKKRAAGEKPSWKVDTSHEGAIFSHICKWKRGEKADADSGAHPLVHTAWRCLAIAYQETRCEEVCDDRAVYMGMCRAHADEFYGPENPTVEELVGPL